MRLLHVLQGQRDPRRALNAAVRHRLSVASGDGIRRWIMGGKRARGVIVRALMAGVGTV